MPWVPNDLVQVKSSELTPAVVLSSAFKYTSNPEKAAVPTKKDGTTADLSFTFTMGLGEYGLGEEVDLHTFLHVYANAYLYGSHS